MASCYYKKQRLEGWPPVLFGVLVDKHVHSCYCCSPDTAGHKCRGGHPPLVKFQEAEDNSRLFHYYF